MRERFFKPRLRFATLAELNAWLLDRCVSYARAHPHPERHDTPVWEAFEAERASLVPYAAPFDGFHAKAVSVSKTCLVQFDKNKYSVMSQAVVVSDLAELQPELLARIPMVPYWDSLGCWNALCTDRKGAFTSIKPMGALSETEAVAWVLALHN